jgi:hypothetical protein
MNEPTVRMVEANRNRRKSREPRAGNDSTIRPGKPRGIDGRAGSGLD